ncbi:hypothetical protein J6590_058348 [Homalodisca vitripennis]|nr:hypothetical protein J6590_058348 [Homalodisca vitripennis]
MAAAQSRRVIAMICCGVAVWCRGGGARREDITPFQLLSDLYKVRIIDFPPCPFPDAAAAAVTKTAVCRLSHKFLMQRACCRRWCEDGTSLPSCPGPPKTRAAGSAVPRRTDISIKACGRRATTHNGRPRPRAPLSACLSMQCCVISGFPAPGRPLHSALANLAARKSHPYSRLAPVIVSKLGHAPPHLATGSVCATASLSFRSAPLSGRTLRYRRVSVGVYVNVHINVYASYCGYRTVSWWTRPPMDGWRCDKVLPSGAPESDGGNVVVGGMWTRKGGMESQPSALPVALDKTVARRGSNSAVSCCTVLER